MDRDALTMRVGAALAGASRVRVAFVFGSQLTGNARPESDLDVGVRYRAGASFEEREEARRTIVEELDKALGALGERADIVDLDECNSAVAFRAIRDGLCVYESAKGQRVEAVARIQSRYADDAPRRELFFRAAQKAFAPRSDG